MSRHTDFERKVLARTALNLHRRNLRSKRKKKRTILLKRAPLFIPRHGIYNDPVSISLPKKFSLIENASEVINFFHNAHMMLLQKEPIIFDMEKLELATSDAICLLLCKVSDRKWTNYTMIYAKKPKLKEIDKIFHDSGFYKMVKMDESEPEYAMIKTMQERRVDTKAAQEARKLVSKLTFQNDQKYHALYRSLIECMGNTKQHAKGKNQKDQTWWLSVYNEPNTKITSFTFIDTGVGILGSSKVAGLIRKAKYYVFKNRAHIILDILQGKIESSTGLHYRGRGLPKIYTDYMNKDLHHLVIITNRAFLDLDKKIYVEMRRPFKGTFLYWEIKPGNLKK